MNVLFRIIVALQTFFAWLLTPIFRLRGLKYRKSLPKIQDDILKCSATVLAEKIRTKQLTSREIIEAYIARIKAVNPIINAVVEHRFSDALEDAEKVDKMIASNEMSEEHLAREYPLLGVPVTIKESCKLEGLSYSVASRHLHGEKADKDGQSVAKLRRAGAIPLLVSNTPELCGGWETTNFVTGRTLNPYNTGRSPGGSSGGEGALLGSGASVIGVGSDVAGSVRLPAMFNGVFGHKPTARVISIKNHRPISSDERIFDYLAIGPMVRYAQDLKLMTKVISEEPNRLNLDGKIDLKKLRIFSKHEAETSFVLSKVNGEIKKSLDKCLDHLKNNCGCHVDDYKFDMSETCEMSGTLLYAMDDIPNCLRDPKTKEDTNNLHLELLKCFLGLSKYTVHGLFFYFLQRHNIFVPRSKYDEYKVKAERLKDDFIAKLGDNGVFLYPTFPTLAFEHDKFLLLTSGAMYTMVFNVLGMPATNVPMGRSKNGLPIGIQVVAAPHQDRLCFAVAEELEKAFGGWVEP